MPHWLANVYFGFGGVALVGIGIALLTDFRGIGTLWERGTNQHAAVVNKLLRLPWPSNPYLGPTLRPAAAVFFIVVGSGMIVFDLYDLIRHL